MCGGKINFEYLYINKNKNIMSKNIRNIKNFNQFVNEKVITDLNEIDRDTKEGRLLFAALVKITTEILTDKTPYEVLGMLEYRVEKRKYQEYKPEFEFNKTTKEGRLLLVALQMLNTGLEELEELATKMED